MRYNRHFGSHAETIRQLRCCVCAAPPPSDPHHVQSRGAGGTKRDLVPLCRHCHDYGHSRGWQTLEREANINLREIADELWRQHGEESDT